MSSRITMSEVNNKDKKIERNKPEEKEVLKPTTAKKVSYSDDDVMRRQTYFLTEDMIRAISLKSAFEEKDKSAIVREALKSYIEDKYFNM